MKRIVFLCLLFLGLALTAQSQLQDDNVTWRLSVKMTSPTEGNVVLKANIEPGWHLYGTQPVENGPVPTAFDFSDSEGVVFCGDFTPSVEPDMSFDENFGTEVGQWHGKVTFILPFTLTGSKEDVKIKGKIRFMSCNDINCTPPRTISLSAN